MLVGVDSPDPWTRETIVARARGLALHGAGPTPTFVEDARLVLDEPLRTDDVPLLTDDYAPVDTMDN